MRSAKTEGEDISVHEADRKAYTHVFGRLRITPDLP
jgi:hypothetical protein